jgi:alpha-beta hydrolase superfamily lysophospholipase
MHEERLVIPNSRGDALTAVLHHAVGKTNRGAVILCHGMESNKESEKILLFSRELALKGITALRFDFAYVGESSAKFEDITYSGEVEDLKAAYSLLRARHSGKIAILGSSMGGTVALLFAAQEPSIAGLVTIAAPVHPEEFPKRILTPSQLQQWRDQGFTFYNGQRINVALLHDLERINVPQAAKNITCPILIVHGDADTVVPVKEAYELYSCIGSSKQLSILKGADHRLSNWAIMKPALNDALEWLTEHVC